MVFVHVQALHETYFCVFRAIIWTLCSIFACVRIDTSVGLKVVSDGDAIKTGCCDLPTLPDFMSYKLTGLGGAPGEALTFRFHKKLQLYTPVERTCLGFVDVTLNDLCDVL